MGNRAWRIKRCNFWSWVKWIYSNSVSRTDCADFLKRFQIFMCLLLAFYFLDVIMSDKIKNLYNCIKIQKEIFRTNCWNVLNAFRPP